MKTKNRISDFLEHGHPEYKTPRRSTLGCCVVLLCLVGAQGFQGTVAKAEPASKPESSSQSRPDYFNRVTIPQIDLDAQSHRQVVVDREKGQYLGHPTTCLLEDGKTILCVYPKGHGRGAIVYKRSKDAGRTWSDRLPAPESWATSKEVPTLHRVIDAQGVKRIIMWSGLYPARLAVSENDGANWSELEPVGDWGGIVVMGCVEPLATGPGRYLAMFHDDGRFFKRGSGQSFGDVPTGTRTNTMTLYKTFSGDGGLHWSYPEAIHAASEVHLCEPGCIRSPDGKQLAVLLRENARRKNSYVIFSNDEGKTWSQPREVPLALTGDRHTGKYGPDGRLFISFRCRSPRDKAEGRPFEGDWAGWVGTYDDIVHGREGQYVVRVKHNTKGYDTTYPGVEVLPDGTLVTTTYGHWDQGEAPYILCVRFRLDELDAMAAGSVEPETAVLTETAVFTPRQQCFVESRIFEIDLPKRNPSCVLSRPLLGSSFVLHGPIHRKSTRSLETSKARRWSSGTSRRRSMAGSRRTTRSSRQKTARSKSRCPATILTSTMR